MSFSRPTMREPDKGASQPLFLSLFLLLLAFFILLNALSTIETGRSDQVLESVQRAFPSSLRAAVGDSLLEGEPGQVIGESLRAQIGEVFAQTLPVARITVEPNGNPIYADAPVAQIYAPAIGGLTPAGAAFARRISPLLETPPPGSVLELDVLFQSAPGTSPAEREDRARTAANVIEGMIGFGIDPAVLSIGLTPGVSDTVRFVFRTRPATETGPVFDPGPRTPGG